MAGPVGGPGSGHSRSHRNTPGLRPHRDSPHVSPPPTYPPACLHAGVILSSSSSTCGSLAPWP